MKTFTVSEANAALIELEPQLLKIQKHHEFLTSRRAESQAASAASQYGGGMKEGSAYVAALCEMAEIASSITQRGIEIKDVSRGLIDFPSFRNGRVVYLCWQLGDGGTVEFWHEQDTGFAGRKPL